MSVSSFWSLSLFPGPPCPSSPRFCLLSLSSHWSCLLFSPLAAWFLIYFAPSPCPHSLAFPLDVCPQFTLFSISASRSASEERRDGAEEDIPVLRCSQYAQFSAAPRDPLELVSEWNGATQSWYTFYIWNSPYDAGDHEESDNGSVCLPFKDKLIEGLPHYKAWVLESAVSSQVCRGTNYKSWGILVFWQPCTLFLCLYLYFFFPI